MLLCRVMRKAILGVIAIGALLLLGILAWWFMYTRQIQSELAQYEREVASKKKIKMVKMSINDTKLRSTNDL